jgi:peptidoglycan hydrolase-like protein with peptidoglycan-binding domain
MELTRNLKRGMSGKDVREVKEMLFKLGFYSKTVKKIANNIFGSGTYKAVKAFQKKYNLVVDGIVGKNTMAKLNTIYRAKEVGVDVVTANYVTAKGYPRLSEGARAKINEALSGVSYVRRQVVLEALKYATDASIASQFKYPSSLYIRGGNLYNKDNTLNVIPLKYLKDGEYKKRYASFCTNGRLEMMIKAVEADPDTTGADCSGGIIGLFRHFGLIKMNTDATANGLCGSGYSTTINKVDLTAGDFVGKDGHICLYVGGGLMVEWAGGAYGCQLTEVSNRRCWSFTTHKMVKMAACTRYRRPKVY